MGWMEPNNWPLIFTSQNMGKVNKKKLALEAFPKWIVRYIRIRLQFILMHPY